MRTLVILISIATLVSVVVSLALRVLVTTNKIKTNKVTRLFYYDDESFIKSWEKSKEKGIFIYNIKNFIMFIVFYGILVLINFSKDTNSIMYGREHIIPLLIIIILLSLLSSLIRWGLDQDRYSKL